MRFPLLAEFGEERPLRASIIDIDTAASKANAVLDYQDIQASLSGSTSSSGSSY